MRWSVAKGWTGSEQARPWPVIRLAAVWLPVKDETGSVIRVPVSVMRCGSEVEVDLEFRRIEKRDLPMIMRWRTSPEVTRHMYTDPQLTLEGQREWLRSISMDPTREDYIIRADGEDLGVVSVYRIDRANRRCDWGCYLASPNARGRGIGRSVELSLHYFVFEDLGLNKLCGEVFSWNEKVIAIHRKLGSKVEGRRLQHIFKDGEYHDIVEVGLVKSDWEKNVKGRFEFSMARIAMSPRGRSESQDQQ